MDPRAAKQVYIISSQDFQHNQTIYRIGPDTRIQRIHPGIQLGVYPALIPQTPQHMYPLHPAMLQVRETIIDLVIWSYLRTNNPEMALPLICIDSSTLRRFYNKVYGSFYPNTPGYRRLHQPCPIRVHLRISKTLQFIRNLIDLFIAFNVDDSFEYIAAETTIDRDYFPGHSIAPWDFAGMIDLVETVRPLMIQPYHRAFRAIQTGDFVTDIAWVAGLSSHGLLISDLVRVPVIHLILKDVEDNLIPRRNQMRHNIEFQHFARLLKHCFGPHTGVFVSVYDPTNSQVLCMELDTASPK